MPFARSRAHEAHVIATVGTVVGCVLAGVGSWFLHAGGLPSSVSAQSLIQTDVAAPIFIESDVTTTESLLELNATSSTPLSAIESGPVASTTEDGLNRPALAHLKGIAGDPILKKDEWHIQVPVFMYHHVRPFRSTDTSRERFFTVTPEVFEAQLKSLVEQGYHFITPTDLQIALHTGPSTLPTKPVLLTFDDGLRDHYKTVFPLLQKYNAKATFFVITTANHLNGYLTNAMIKELDESGLVTIASHTEHHPFLTRLSIVKQKEEIAGSKQSLESLLGHPVTSFAYPYGDVNATIYKEVEDAGYDLGFGVRLGSMHGESSRFQLRRIRVQQGERLSDLADAFSKE